MKKSAKRLISERLISEKENIINITILLILKLKIKERKIQFFFNF